MTRRTLFSLLFLTGSSVLYIATSPLYEPVYVVPTVALPGLHLGPDLQQQVLHVTITAESITDVPTEVMDLVGYLHADVLAGEGAATLTLLSPYGETFDVVLTAQTPEVEVVLPWTRCDDGLCRAEADIAFWTEGDANVLLEPVLELSCYNSGWDDLFDAIAYVGSWSRTDTWPFEEDAR
ncbi:MAG: hypothetical protein ABIO70_02530 [Pseudomonadota bacterium]